MMDYERELQAALLAAEHASAAVLRAYAEWTPIPDAPTSISTPADRESQDMILTELAAQFPQDAFRAEEATLTLAQLTSQGQRMWIIDPIDGTKGFAQKNGEFSVMIGLAVAGVTMVGVVTEPVAQRWTFAAQGIGCWTGPLGDRAAAQRVQVSAITEPSAATLTLSHSRRNLGIQEHLGVARVRPTNSAGLKLALVARGEADVYVYTYETYHDWDVCAGVILVEEAGGRVTNFAGEALTLGGPEPACQGGLIASNGRVHEALRRRWLEA